MASQDKSPDHSFPAFSPRVCLSFLPFFDVPNVTCNFETFCVYPLSLTYTTSNLILSYGQRKHTVALVPLRESGFCPAQETRLRFPLALRSLGPSQKGGGGLHWWSGFPLWAQVPVCSPALLNLGFLLVCS